MLNYSDKILMKKIERKKEKKERDGERKERRKKEKEGGRERKREGGRKEERTYIWDNFPLSQKEEDKYI